ncbi:MAG: ABC transporter ATP-binding protein, partial [Armatimonadota bacterium]|nr:ABC transporter ATP-binding protein [Armatimonadota bacterium]
AARPVRALAGISLRIEPGEVFGLVGPNGAGKTTLLKLLATLLLPSEGAARVDGADLVSQAGMVRRRVGLATGDERTFYWRLTGRENLEFFCGLRGQSPAVARRRAAEVLERVDLVEQADETVGRYSTGMRQRLAIARALLDDPPVLLLDEPTRSLDPVAAARVQTLIRRLSREEGRTVLLATHQLGEAATACDRIGILVAGALRDVLAPQAVGEDGLRRRYHALVEATDERPQSVAGLS